MRITTLLAVAVSGLLIALGVPALASGNPGSAGIGDRYFPKDGNGGYDVLRYNIHNRYRFGSGKLTGWTRITATATQDLSRFNLDLLLPVSKVQVNGTAARFSKPTKHELQIRPTHAIPAGTTFKVKVKYAGQPAALSYLGERNWLASGDEVVTMNEPHMAPWWFPANDHPVDKAAMRIHITVPRGREVLANGELVRKTKRPGLSTWHWRAAEPMVPYLAFFAAGEFSIKRGTSNGLPWINGVSRGLSANQQATAHSMLEQTPSVVAWLESELGDYPFSISGGVVTNLNPGFSLETQTRPTYHYLGTGGLSTVVHEQAHQWVGDDVAVRRWRDIWLNEGFATYLEVRYAETHGGPAAEAWLASGYALRPAGDSFWSIRIGRPGPARIFDGPVYVRGAMTLVALRNRIGEADLSALLRAWVTQRSGGNGSTEQFIALAEAISGEDLTGFFDAWLFTSAKPAATPENGL